MKIIATIEARMSSSRLPGKVLLPAGGEPILQHMIDRVKRVSSVHDIILATTDNPADDKLVSFARGAGIRCFRGSEEDVMARVIGAGEAVNADVIVGLTGDCPIIDPNLIEQMIRVFLNNPCDYASNCAVRSYPDGMDVQVFPLTTLQRSAAMTDDPFDREHVTLHIRNHPDQFRLIHLVAPPDLHWPKLGLTLDEESDYVLLKKIIEFFGNQDPFFTCGQVIALLREKPDWVKINRHVCRTSYE